MSKRLVIFILVLLVGNISRAQVLRKRTTRLMGSKFDIILVAQDSLAAENHIDTVISEITRIENLISEWKPESEVSEVNRNAGVRPVRVSREVFELTKRAIYYSQITEGAFDISFAAMDKIWRFDGSMKELPSPEAVKKSVEKVGYKNIVLDSVQSTVFLRLEGMKISFGSIGKGYAADCGRTIMLEKGVRAGIVNASGDMSVWGKQPNGKNWVIGINNPFKADKIIKKVLLRNGAVTTSGNYEKYVVLNGKRYAHIINPVTGYPATGLCSVTVMGPSAEMANGFSTSLIVLGVKDGLKLLSKYPEYNCIMITDEGKVIKKNSPNN